jgi:hypothetical protein
VARTIGGIAAVLLALGFLMARGFLKRYALACDPETGGPGAYHAVALADHFFLIRHPDVDRRVRDRPGGVLALSQ